MTMLTEEEKLRAEIERLNDIIRRAAWLEQAPEERTP